MGYLNTSGSHELNYEQAKEKALRLLEFRSHSEQELRMKLKRAGARDEDIGEILDFCRNYGFVNDREYALRKARDLKNLKKYGKRRIYAELKHRGISEEDAAIAVSELEDDEEDTLYPLAEKKLNGNFERKNIDKCIRYFISRGYEIGDIKRCIERIKGEWNGM